nr:DNA-dependent metalloprotease WSS1-like [Ipomoea batatas]
MSMGDMNKVWEIKALKRKPKGEEAQKILERIAKQVQPIMRKHSWRVKVLSEFCPKNPALLGVNVGAGINVKLRLRRVNRDEEFLPFNSVLDTMLHELCHNAHSAHNSSFYKLWDELRKECEDLMSKGISGTGEGFDLPGKRLGGFFPQPSLSSLRKTAAAAAEKRAHLKSLLPPGPKRLGGNKSIMGALTPIQAAAMAAERRLQDNIWCASESCNMHGDDDDDDSDPSLKPLNVEPTSVKPKLSSSVYRRPINTIPQKRNREPTNVSFSSSSVDHNVFTSTSESVPSHRDKSCKKVHAEGTSRPQPPYDHKGSDFVDLTDDNSNQRLVPSHDVVHSLENSVAWECSMCTLLNPLFAPICELCQARKPKDSDDKDKMWSCKFCTLDNSTKLEKCAACGEWRYSHGPPVATPAPNLGT